MPPPMMKNFQQSYKPLSMAFSLLRSSKIVVMSAKKRRKKGKMAPESKAEMEPIMSWTLYEAVVYAKRERKEAGGSFFSSEAGAILDYF